SRRLPPRGQVVTPTAVGALGIVVMLVLMALRVPIGVSMGVVGFSGFAYLNGWGAALAMLGLVPYGNVASFTLTVLPLFVLMGHFAAMAGISQELYDTANRWFGHFRVGWPWPPSWPAAASRPSAARASPPRPLWVRSRSPRCAGSGTTPSSPRGAWRPVARWG